MFRLLASGSAVLAVVLVTPLSALAINLGEWVPGLKVSPFITQHVTYETNVFQAPTGAEDDIIFRTIPGVLADYTAGPLTLSAGYRLEILRFMDLEGQDNEHHIALGQIKYDGPRLMALIRDDFVRTSDPPGSELTGRIESTTNILAPQLEYKLTSRLSVGTNYTWTHVNFDRSAEQLDRDEHQFGGSVFWKFIPRADVAFNYRYGKTTFDQDTNPDVTRHFFFVGLRGDLTARLSSTFRVGYEFRDTEASGAEDAATLAMGGDFVYRPTDRTRFSLLLDRTTQESIFANTFFYTATTGTLLLEQQFGPKLSAKARFTAGSNDYPVREADQAGRLRFRDDTILGWGAGLDYEIQRWLSVGAEYAHSRRESNFDQFDYKDDKVTAKVTLQF